MKHSVSRLLSAVLLLVPVVVFAADEAGHPPLVDGNAESGAKLAATCMACHGPNGVSTVPTWPKLAGQGALYIDRQLEAFKSGERKNPIMLGQAVSLSAQNMKDLAVYFSEQKSAPGVASKDSIAIAQPLYRGGDAKRGIPACAACHGPTGAGNPAAAYPRLAGQHAEYTATQLRAYRAGERNHDSNSQTMSAVALKLTDPEIEALASYINGLQ